MVHASELDLQSTSMSTISWGTAVRVHRGISKSDFRIGSFVRTLASRKIVRFICIGSRFNDHVEDTRLNEYTWSRERDQNNPDAC